jgi:hypothetical protein
LDQLNNLFLESYKTHKEGTKRSLNRPVILINGDDLILRQGATRKVIKYVPDEYHTLKSIAHIACLIHTLDRDPQASSATRIRCQHLVKQLLASLNEKGTSANLKKHRPLLEQYQILLQQERPSLSSLKPELEALIDAAAKCRLEALHKQVQEVRGGIDPAHWERLSVIVMGPPMPREGELGMQYFHTALTSSQPSLMDKCPHLNRSLTSTQHIFQGKRLIYAESITDEDKALDLLTTYICDEQMGADILDDRGAMRADFLKKSAHKHLQTMDFTTPTS